MSILQSLGWTPGTSMGDVTQTGTQTLTNKTINGANNTLTVRLANDITGFGTGVATALAVNVGSAGAFTTFNGAGGTPSSLTLTNATGLPASSLTAGVLAANITFGENTEIILDAALSADGKYCGLTEDGTAAVALAFGEVCYLVAGSSRWDKADSDAAATSGPVKVGICVLAAAGAASATRMLLWGKIRADAQFPAMTVSAPMFISGTAGAITGTAPVTTDSVTRIVGYGNTGDELFWCPDQSYYTHT